MSLVLESLLERDNQGLFAFLVLNMPLSGKKHILIKKVKYLDEFLN
jgi:hypothetical protein